MDVNFTCKFDPSNRNSFFPKDIDGFRCGLATMMLILYNINFGFICGALLLLLAIISIFGGIKEHYRWFILNQVLWDALMTYRFVCDNYIARFFYSRKACPSSAISGSLLGDVPHASYSALLLLSFSRFLCLYFKQFYERLTNGHRIFVTIVIYNFIIIITTTPGIFLLLQKQNVVSVFCEALPEAERANCAVNTPMDDSTDSGIIAILIKIESFTSCIKPPLFLLISIFSTFMLILKISKQFKFQRKNNIKDFYISLRITIVIAFQTLMYLFIFSLEIVFDFLLIFIELFFPRMALPLDSLPAWYGAKFGLSFPPLVHNFIQIRIFIESLIILFVMSGYREAIIRFFKFLFSWIGFKSNGRSKTPVTVMINEGNGKTQTSLRSLP